MSAAILKPVFDRSDKEEVELIRAAAGGCHDAFTSLVVRHQDRVFQVCFRLLNCRDDAREVCQEVFISAFKALPRFRPEAKLSTWLYQIAVNRCRDHWKRSSSKLALKSHSLDPASFSLSSEEAHPGEVAEWSDELLKLQAGLKAISSKHREIIILSCIEGLSHGECAEVLNCSPRAVEGRLRRARKALSEFLASED